METLDNDLRALYNQYLARGEDGRDIVDTMISVAIEIAEDESDDVISRLFGHD